MLPVRPRSFPGRVVVGEMTECPHQDFRLTAVDILSLSRAFPVIEGDEDEHGRVISREKITEKIGDFEIFFRFRMTGDGQDAAGALGQKIPARERTCAVRIVRRC